MNITQINHNIKCDISGCKNKATYRIDLKKNLFNTRTHICESCLTEIYKFMAKKKTPKGVKNAFAKPKRVEE